MDGNTKPWGRDLGRVTGERLVSAISTGGERRLVKLSMEGVEQIDASFASEAIAEVIGRYRKKIGICLVDLSDEGIRFNIDMAAAHVDVPVTVWNGAAVDILGAKPSSGNREALSYALERREVRASEFADVASISIANASTKFKSLWDNGFLMRVETAADSGGVEFLYRRIG